MDNSTRPPSHRSHRSLNQLSLNPLISTLPPTPPSPTLAPITPASYISPTTLPSTKYPSILSRSSSRTKLRSPGPGPTPTTDPSDSNPPLPKSRPGSRHHSRRGTSTESSAYDADSSWLTRTASTLAMQSMEEKGRVWLASRTSATSLSHPQQPASYEDRVCRNIWRSGFQTSRRYWDGGFVALDARITVCKSSAVAGG
ncbi:MAG: hypothetical protein L6R40_004102 [Gallowayella cf. fulva]|nr:MAG: hypothetical protein L6R40_004102 [Xanthomendoza cf. fulva]